MTLPPSAPPKQQPRSKKRRAPNHADNPTEDRDPRCVQHGRVSLRVDTAEQLNAKNAHSPNQHNADEESDDTEAKHQRGADNKHSNVCDMREGRSG